MNRDVNSSKNLTQIIILLVMIVPTSMSCTYDLYEDALLNEENQANLYHIDSFIPNEDGDSIGFGFWSYSIPQWSPKVLVEIENMFNPTLQESGLFLFLIKSGLKNIALGYASGDYKKKLIYHNIVFFQDQNILKQFTFAPITYIANWILTSITYNLLNQEFIVVSNNVKYKQSFTLEQNSMTVYLGGRGFFNQNWNLNVFNGRLSKLFVRQFKESTFSLFDYMIQFCQVPKQNQEEQVVYLIKGLKQFSGDTLLMSTIKQFGNRYCLSGWVKYDFSKVIDETRYLVFRISSRQYYNKELYMGDEILKLEMNAALKQKAEYCNLILRRDEYILPSWGKINYRSNNFYSYIFSDIYHDFYYYNGLQQWHFFQIEYGSEVANKGLLIQFQFFNELGLVQQKAAIPGISDSLFYFFIGGDDFTKSQLDAQMFDFKFEYNYDQHKTIQLNVCHYSCLTCKGPLEDNCLTCSSSSNRNFVQEQNKCQCKYGYINQEGQQLCIQFNQMFPSVQMTETQMTEYAQCPQGYFFVPNQSNSNNCVICPQSNYGDFSCIDCYQQTESWYLKPKCTRDLISRKLLPQDGFYYKERNLIDYDLYIIDENGFLILQQGLLDFCDDYYQDSENCFKYKKLHLGQSIYVKCKPNFYNLNGECIFKSIYCLLLDSQGQCSKIIDGMYLKDEQYLICPSNCLTCKYDEIVKQPQCLTCPEYQTLENGQCLKCGNFCKICRNYYDARIQQSYLKCFKCIDDSKYLISFDAINCQQNKIDYCSYAFQMIFDDPSINTLDLYFTPRYDIENIITFCGKCEYGFVFVIEINKCELMIDFVCHFAYAQSLCNIEITSDMIGELDDFYQITIDDDTKISAIYNEFYDYQCITQHFCMISDDYISNDATKIVQYFLSCPSQSQNCVSCLKDRNFKIDFCLECNVGYYANKLTGKCNPCPKELNCFQCFQQQSLSQDQWKIQIRAAYQVIINSQNNHSFQEYGQSLDSQDYIVSCQICNKGYQLVNDVCILACSDTCLECIYENGQNSCVRCQLESQGRRLSISKNSCIKCPENCELCIERSQYQINQINPLFSNQLYNEYTYKCLKSFNDHSYQYDNELGSYINCLQESKCQREIQITLNLYCNQSEYYNDLNQLQNEKEKVIFRQQNILIQDLISDSSFKEFENDYFYSSLNQQLIKTISIKIIGKKQQICIIERNATIQQQFSNNIFSTKSVYLEMILPQQTLIIFDQTIQFINFQKIYIQGASFQPVQSDRLKSILFKSVFKQTVILDKLIYEQTSSNYDKSELIFQNIEILVIKDTQIINLKQKENDFLFFIEKTNYQKQITFQNLQLINLQIENQATFLFQLQDQDSIKIFDLKIQAKLTNTTLLESFNLYSGTIHIQNLYLQIIIDNSPNAFNFYSFIQVQIQGVIIENSNIYNSTLISLNNNASIQDFKIQLCKFNELSFALRNVDNYSAKDQNIHLTDIIFDSNEYHFSAKFLQLNKLNHQFSKLYIKKFLILNNFLNSLSNYENLFTINYQLVNFQMDIIIIEELMIERGYGLIEIYITNVQSLKLINSKITQGEKFQFKGLHQYLDCYLQKVNHNYQLTSIFLTSIFDLQINGLIINKSQSQNYPLLYIKSQDKAKQYQDEKILLSNMLIYENMLLITQLQQQTSIIFIESSQPTQISLTSNQFYENILLEYLQDNLQPSALLLNIDCYLGTIEISNSSFSKNSIINSTHDIIYIKSYKLIMAQNIFQQNSLYDYEVIKPYILWGKFESEFAYIEDFEQIFKIKSLTGNGQFLLQEIYISQCQFQQSIGFLGGAFQIIGQKNTIVNIFNSSFYNLSTTFNSNSGFGGAIYLDGTSSLSLSVNIQRVIIENIFTQQYGGFLYMESECSQIQLNITEIQVRNVYANYGSIMYLQFSFAFQNQVEVIISNLTLQNTKEVFIDYLNQYTSLQKFQEIDLINNRYLFYVYSVSNVIFKNITIQNLIFESAFMVNNAINLKILDVEIVNCLLSNKLASINPNSYYQNIFQISNLNIINITIIQQVNNYHCQSNQDRERNIQMSCQITEVPPTLHQDSQTQYNNFGQCIYTYGLNQTKLDNYNLLESESSGLFVLNQMTIQSLLKIENINFMDIQCKLCQYGLFYFLFPQDEGQLKNQHISNIKVTNCICGNLGCINIIKNQQTTRRLQSYNQQNQTIINLEFLINNYICLNNTGNNGTCLNIDNIKVMVVNSIFKFNNAINSGGAVYVAKEQNFFSQNSVISNNAALIGGGLYFLNQQELNYTRFSTKVFDNKGTEFGNDLASIPSGLSLVVKYEDSYFEKEIINQTEFLLIEQIKFSDSKENNYIKLPSGQQIDSYQQFYFSSRLYKQFGYLFRIIALGKQQNIIRNLKGTFCEIQSRMINSQIIIDDNQFSNNYTNIQNITFNEVTQDYNLDQLIVYFDNELPNYLLLQLQFSCNSIVIPIYNYDYPYNVIKTHKNYKLRINVKTLPCQYGEIKNYTDFSCQQCDGNKGLFSLTLNQQTCEIKDDVSTVSVQSTLLNLKPGFWRPYFNSNQITYCINLPENCMGGWIEGDSSCHFGHIGALCEQCDIYNIRGDGFYSISQQYTCGSCLNQGKNIIIITFVSIWTLISIFISVQSTIKAIETYVRIFQIKKMGLAVQQTNNESAILIKMLTNYLQIIGFIATFQLKLPSGFESTVNVASSPIQTMAYSLDCFLTSMFNFQIHYSRMIWQVIMPLIYITFFFICYVIAAQFKLVVLNKSAFTTTFIYMYIYLQPSLVGGFVQLISYRQISGYKWILANIAYRFDTYSHQQWMLNLCFPMLLFIAILIPSFFLWELFRNRYNLDNKQTRLKLGYLYNEYTQRTFFWEIIKIAQKELMIIFLTYFQDRIIIKATIILLIIAFYLEVTYRSRPYSSNNLNKLDYNSTYICMISIGLAIGIYVAYQSNLVEIQIPYFILLAIINFQFVLKITWHIVVQIFKEKSDDQAEILDKIRDKIKQCFPFIQKFKFFNLLLKNRKQQKIRVAKNYKKLKNFLIPQAKEIIAFKNQRLQLAYQLQDQIIETIPLSIRNYGLQLEKQQLVNSKEGNNVFDQSRNILKSQTLDIQQNEKFIKEQEVIVNAPLRRQKLPSLSQVFPIERFKSEY